MATCYPKLSFDSKKMTVREVYELLLGPYKFSFYNEMNDVKIGAYQVAMMLDHFKTGSVISLSSSESKEQINKTTGSFAVSKIAG